jgi:hypothetical protein
VAQPGRAPVLGTGGRVFESRRPDNYKILFFNENSEKAVLIFLKP